MTPPLADRAWIVGLALVYLALLLAIGAWSVRRTRNARDFFIAGQRMGLLVVGMATMASAFSGFVFLGGPGLTFRIGLASLFIVLPVGFTAGMLCRVVGRKLRTLAGVREIYTIPDLLEARFRSRPVTGLAAIAVACGSIAYLGLQLQALGIGLQAILGTERLAVAMLIGLAVLSVYSIFGGMVAGMYTDLLQGVMMIVTAVAVFACVLGATDGWSGMTGSILGSPDYGRPFLEPFGRVPVFTAFGFFFVFGIGVLGQPHMLHKFFMLDDPRKLRWLPLVLAGSQAACVLLWLGIGLAVPALVARGELTPPANPDDVAPLFLLNFTPAVVTALAFAGLLAAIMSTADSFLNIGSAALVRDLPRALRRPVRDELLWGRLAVLLVGAAAALLAWIWGDLIALLGTFAFGSFAAALAPAIAIGLNWARVTAPAAAASIATGLVVNLTLELLPESPLAPGVLPAAAALAASFTMLFIVTWATSRARSCAIEADVRAVVES